MKPADVLVKEFCLDPNLFKRLYYNSYYILH